VTDILSTVLPVLVTLLLGVICRKRSALSREGVNALKNVAVNIALPAVLLNAFATTRYTWADLVIPLIMFAVCVIAWLTGRVLGRAFRMKSRFVPFLTTGFEAGMLGYALFNMLYGAERTAEFARVDLGQVLFVFTAYKVLLGMDGQQKPTCKQLFRDMASSPIILAILSGVLIGATGLYEALVPSGVSAVFDACVGFIAAPTAVLILLAVGYDLDLSFIPWRDTLKAAALRLAVMLALGLALVPLANRFLPELRLNDALIVMLILPPPFVLPVFADDPEQRTYVSSVLTVSTLAAVVGFAVLAAIK